MEENSLAILDKATQMLAYVHTIDDAKKIIDIAEAARVYARQVELGLEAQNHATEIKLRAQRRAGDILNKMEKAKGARGIGPSPLRLHDETAMQPPTYAELGIEKRDAHVWQTLATMPEDKFQEKIEQTKKDDGELSTAALYREAKRAIAGDKPEPPSLPNDKFRVIYADPPWKYSDNLIVGYGSATHHYPSLSIDELCALPIAELSDSDSVLFLWVTSPMLEECFRIINTWGFEYKTSFVWDKVKHNYGHYNSVRHEFLLVCTRGSCIPDNPKLFDSVQQIERSSEHSEKPKEFREIIDTLYTHGKKIELFARHPAEGWEVWGNEVR